MEFTNMINSEVTHKITDTTAAIAKTTQETSAPPIAAALKSNHTLLNKFKNVVSSMTEAPGKLIAYIAKEKPTLAAVETTAEEGVIAVAQTVQSLAEEVEKTAVAVENVAKVVAIDAKETEKIAEKIDKVVKEVEAATDSETKEPRASITKSAAAS